MRARGLGFWGGVSAAIHAALLLAILLDLAFRKINEPTEQAVAVEIVAALPPSQAQGERPAPVPGPPEPLPLPPVAQPPPEPRRPVVEAPSPPPPPPPPAPAPPPSQQAAVRPAPTPPPPAPAPSVVPTPPVAVAEARPTPSPPAAQPSRAEPALPLPPPPTPTPPQPVREAGTAATPPAQRPQERSQSVLNTLERLRQQQQQEPPRARPNPAAAQAAGGGAPTGIANLTAGEIRGLADQIGECWSVDAGAPNLADIVVELRVRLDGQGNVRNVVPASAVPSEPRARAVYEAARRALLAPQCNPLKVPATKIAALEVSTFRFSPKGLVR